MNVGVSVVLWCFCHQKHPCTECLKKMTNPHPTLSHSARSLTQLALLVGSASVPRRVYIVMLNLFQHLNFNIFIKCKICYIRDPETVLDYWRLDLLNAALVKTCWVHFVHTAHLPKSTVQNDNDFFELLEIPSSE